jgi:hypothetical protein
MSFMRDGIQNVRVFALPDGVRADGRRVAVFGAALVTWHSSHAGMVHQVYLNGRFAGVTLDSQQRRLVVQAPGSFRSAVRVTLIAVAPADAYVDFADDLEQATVSSGRVRLSLLRSQTLSFRAMANIYYDNGTGQIDYATPLNAAPIPIWPCMHDKAGFGLSQLGMGDFGYDSAASIGFGKGAFGHGQFGLDADTIEWLSPALPLGTYRFGVRITDAFGNEGPAAETTSITVVPAIQPAVGLTVATFDQSTNELTLSIAG